MVRGLFGTPEEEDQVGLMNSVALENTVWIAMLTVLDHNRDVSHQLLVVDRLNLQHGIYQL